MVFLSKERFNTSKSIGKSEARKYGEFCRLEKMDIKNT
jgi:hypothetical protein